ncbi:MULTISPECIES: hypothetical protein [Pseudomonadati]|uniref:Uncharacterized protein n=1 Tax=Shewanella aestuarii TaxID=1028752 RepID=A0ABT0L4P1_9GAMM|nr:hypothetical protein [Shewanella aestuarii]MCL1118665.1 hypothetical protein [Shewanella aestuarii]GGN80745.1 hypothetical protein GCM10009193_26210 [Shewanella aestuarii]
MKAIYLLLLLPILATANNLPSFLSVDTDKEYIATIDTLRSLLPKNGDPEILMGLASPYSLLDIQPTKFTSLIDKNQFTNFNLGVMGQAIFKAREQFVVGLPNRVLCQNSTCRKMRMTVINQFMKEQAKVGEFFNQNEDILIVQRTTDDVYRINNDFYTPSGIIQYQPSAVAGFVPSANWSEYKSTEELTSCNTCSDRSIAVRNIMAQYNVAAIVRETNIGVNVIFGGISNNHWGVMVIEQSADKPKVGQRNTLGFEYEDVIELTPKAYYYQTN